MSGLKPGFETSQEDPPLTDTLEADRTSETPHGGVKQSGWGKDGSKYALEDYTFVKHMMINTGS